MSNAPAILAAASDLARSGRAAQVLFGLALVWIADVAAVFASQADRAGFEAMLIEERRASAIDLARCDYVEGFDLAMVRASTVYDGCAEVHFVKVRV